MSKNVESGEFGPVVRLFSALANPIRARIVNRLTDGEASVGELSEIVGVKQPLVSHHLKVLRSAHSYLRVRTGRKPCTRSLTTMWRPSFWTPSTT